ncbi:MAG TPA: MMPL family transporter, partial [Acidimicrobiales bacterium]|nr:MMPL family transporter [Acidimicrobiales bacterium]
LAPFDVVVTDPRRLAAVRSALSRDPVVQQVGPVEHAGHLARFSVLVDSLPSGQRAFLLVDQLRAVVGRASAGAALVGGQTAQDADLARSASQDEHRVIPLVLGVVVVVLAGLLRGLLGPVTVTLTVVGTFAAALGVCAVVFGSLLGYPGVDPTVPLLGFVFLVALGTDYNVFLLGRVSQEVEARGLPEGVVVGLSATGGVLTSAGLILAGTFAVLTILPLLPSKEIGLVVAFGVLLDTLVVRTVLVPSLALSLGRAFWWPRRVTGAAGKRS